MHINLEAMLRDSPLVQDDLVWIGLMATFVLRSNKNLFNARVEVSLLYMESITEQRLLDLFRVSAKSYQPIIIINGDSANDWTTGGSVVPLVQGSDWIKPGFTASHFGQVAAQASRLF